MRYAKSLVSCDMFKLGSTTVKTPDKVAAISMSSLWRCIDQVVVKHEAGVMELVGKVIC